MHFIGLLDQSEGEFGVAFPDCPGCVAMGKDRSEALAGAEAALAEWLGNLPTASWPDARSEAALRGDPDVAEQIADGARFVLIPAPLARP
ncbi:type II toxin-antitoxin system HicB family antitoxin [Rhodoblastus sp.]|uniref:type II toxin-antitoxin system HicB family antitoxin n=1 Tax=Rhodoblastus sp. TaxID=1962975 RepID=UPI0035AFC1CC